MLSAGDDLGGDRALAALSSCQQSAPRITSQLVQFQRPSAGFAFDSSESPLRPRVLVPHDEQPLPFHNLVRAIAGVVRLRFVTGPDRHGSNRVL